MLCPRCNKPGLAIAKTLQLGPDGSCDEYNFQLLHCARCSLRAAGAYEESRRGSDARWHHTAHEIDRADWDRIAADIGRCPAPDKPRCTCEIHVRYGETDDLDNHQPLRGVTTIGEPFTIERR